MTYLAEVFIGRGKRADINTVCGVYVIVSSVDVDHHCAPLANHRRPRRIIGSTAPSLERRIAFPKADVAEVMSDVAKK